MKFYLPLDFGLERVTAANNKIARGEFVLQVFIRNFRSITTEFISTEELCKTPEKVLALNLLKIVIERARRYKEYSESGDSIALVSVRFFRATSQPSAYELAIGPYFLQLTRSTFFLTELASGQHFFAACDIRVSQRRGRPLFTLLWSRFLKQPTTSLLKKLPRVFDVKSDFSVG